MAHQDIPFRVIMPIVQPERTQFTPLFHAILSFLAETAHNELNLTGVEVAFMEHVANPSSRPDLYLTVWEKVITMKKACRVIGYRKRIFLAMQKVLYY